MSEQERVRDLLRRVGTARDRGERAALLARLAEELDLAADDLAADEVQARRCREVIAGLRGQAGMARVAAEFDRHDQGQHSSVC